MKLYFHQILNKRTQLKNTVASNLLENLVCMKKFYIHFLFLFKFTKKYSKLVLQRFQKYEKLRFTFTFHFK